MPIVVKTLPLTKILSHIFLAILVLNISVVFPRTAWMCQCDKDLKRASGCCNCPTCVDKRDGLLSYCHSSGHKAKETNKTVVLKMAGCLCGPGFTVLNLPVNNPFIPIKRADYFSHPPEYYFKTEIPLPLLEEPATSIDRPG